MFVRFKKNITKKISLGIIIIGLSSAFISCNKEAIEDKKNFGRLSVWSIEN